MTPTGDDDAPRPSCWRVGRLIRKYESRNHMGVEPNIYRVFLPPKWMVKIMENPCEQMDDLGGKNHYFWKHPIMAGQPTLI